MPDSVVSSHEKSMFGRSDFLIFHYHSYKKTFARVSVLIWSERDKQHRKKLHFLQHRISNHPHVTQNISKVTCFKLKPNTFQYKITF